MFFVNAYMTKIMFSQTAYIDRVIVEAIFIEKRNYNEGLQMTYYTTALTALNTTHSVL